jgi:hypothetical protein
VLKFLTVQPQVCSCIFLNLEYFKVSIFFKQALPMAVITSVSFTRIEGKYYNLGN